jgi:pseudouridine synthase
MAKEPSRKRSPRSDSRSTPASPRAKSPRRDKPADAAARHAQGSRGGPLSPAARSKSGGEVPEELQDASRGMRLQKVLADAGIGSRRDCEVMIAERRVRVNGKYVTALPAWVDPAVDSIDVDGRELPRPRRTGPAADRGKFQQRVYVLLNKPRGVVSTTRDPEGRTNVLDYIDLAQTVAQRLFPVGRLDADSTGLILLTNDGELANRLTHPRYGVAKQYRVSVKGIVSEKDIEKLKAGLYLAHREGSQGEEPGTKKTVRVKTASIESVRVLGRDTDKSRGDRTRLDVTLREGQNREIRRLFAKLGFNVARLERIAIGPLRNKGLARGEWRLLTPVEVSMLHRATESGD